MKKIKAGRELIPPPGCRDSKRSITNEIFTDVPEQEYGDHLWRTSLNL